MAKKKTPAKKGKNNRMSLISARAKDIYKPGKMKWTAAIKKASDQLKKEGKI